MFGEINLSLYYFFSFVVVNKRDVILLSLAKVICRKSLSFNGKQGCGRTLKNPCLLIVC